MLKRKTCRLEQKVGKLLNYFPGHHHRHTHTRTHTPRKICYISHSKPKPTTINCQIRIKYFVGIKTEAYRMPNAEWPTRLRLLCTGISRGGNLKEPINFCRENLPRKTKIENVSMQTAGPTTAASPLFYVFVFIFWPWIVDQVNLGHKSAKCFPLGWTLLLIYLTEISARSHHMRCTR